MQICIGSWYIATGNMADKPPYLCQCRKLLYDWSWEISQIISSIIKVIVIKYKVIASVYNIHTIWWKTIKNKLKLVFSFKLSSSPSLSQGHSSSISAYFNTLRLSALLQMPYSLYSLFFEHLRWLLDLGLITFVLIPSKQYFYCFSISTCGGKRGTFKRYHCICWPYQL